MLAAGLIDFLRHRRAEVFAFLAAVIIGEKLLVNGVKEIVDRGGRTCCNWSAGTARPSVAARRADRDRRGGQPGALLGVHWLTDIVAGVAIGYGWFLICAVVFGGRVQC